MQGQGGQGNCGKPEGQKQNEQEETVLLECQSFSLRILTSSTSLREMGNKGTLQTWESHTHPPFMLQNFADADFVFDQTPLMSPPSPPCPCWGGLEGGKGGDQKPSYQFDLLCGFTILIMTDTAINETKIHGPCGPSTLEGRARQSMRDTKQVN